MSIYSCNAPWVGADIMNMNSNPPMFWSMEGITDQRGSLLRVIWFTWVSRLFTPFTPPSFGSSIMWFWKSVSAFMISGFFNPPFSSARAMMNSSSAPGKRSLMAVEEILKSWSW